ncbi:SDR family oxidoreductase [Spongiivirga citrea]|uniref:SDR family oxidoreductase n=1 Tax=Spongiivirga citrea TaxID=1481457 RepID=A0A6M0CZ39_9FLAO|nr:SDR family oxidoreductase [Spongiivirga citrea]NER19040.1 SDR family oxidoreductase [Spongiivirga citrea]
MSYFNNKTIWITGASSGIGEAFVHELAKHSCRLILSSRKRDELERVKKEAALIDENCLVLPLDLANYHNMKLIVEEATNHFGKVDILINNAGLSQRSLIAETDISVDEKLMQVNYLGTVALSKAILPHFIANKSGHFAVVTSLMGRFGSPYRSGYCGAKHALHGFFDVMRMEHEKDGVAVTMICPGFIQTNVSKNALTGDGSTQNTMDEATSKGLSPQVCVQKALKAIRKKKFETYIGQGEVKGIYMKRFFPKLLHKLVLKSQVR